jgi:hypothetical protein
MRHAQPSSPNSPCFATARFTVACLIATAITACSVYVKKEPPSSSDDTVVIDPVPVPPTPFPDPDGGGGDDCDDGDATAWSAWSSSGYASYYASGTYSCKQTDDFRWRTSCPEAGCLPLSVFVHYMLTKELGDGVTVHVEAFDNSHFDGYPKGTVEIRDFRASTGEWQKAELHLEPGEYFLRAFMRTDEGDPAPYSFEGMNVVAGEPMGVFGALSAPQKVLVAPSETPSPVHVMLDKLFEKPGTAPDTKAYLRVLLQVGTEDVADVPTQRKVVIALHETEDAGSAPVARFEMASEFLKVEGQVGRAEFVSPSLAPGRYIVRAFLDADGDGFLDQGELGALHQELGAPKLVEIKKDHVSEIALTLAKTP